MSKHIRRTCLRSVALKVEDTALIFYHFDVLPTKFELATRNNN